MKFNITSQDFLGASGYSVHTRNLSTALIKAGVDVGLELAGMPEGWEKEVKDEKVIKAIKADYTNEGTITITPPELAEYKLNARLPFLIPFAVFETNRLHPNWIRILSDKNTTAIFTPSKFCKGIIERDIGDKEVFAIPHGHDPTIFNTKEEKENKLSSNKFTFLFVGGWAQGEKDRKGLPILLRAFSEEFKKNENVRLLVKINPVYNTMNDPIVEFEKLKLKPKEERAEITMIPQLVHPNLMGTFYKASDVLVIPTKGEAFGMPFIESMACGVPCIATNFGGQTDYVNKKNGWLIGSDLIPAEDPNYFYEGLNWAQPRQDELQRLMRRAFENPKEVERKGKESVKEARKYTWEKSAIKVKKILEGLA